MYGARKLLLVLALIFVTSACDRSLSGVYADAEDLAAYEFHRDGTATITVLGTTAAAEYTVDGDRVLVSSAQGTIVLKHRDERLYGPMGLELIRQPE